jgi:hypothetical protein
MSTVTCKDLGGQKPESIGPGKSIEQGCHCTGRQQERVRSTRAAGDAKRGGVLTAWEDLQYVLRQLAGRRTPQAQRQNEVLRPMAFSIQMTRLTIMFLFLIVWTSGSAAGHVTLIQNPGDFAPPMDGLAFDQYGDASANDGDTLAVLASYDRNVLVPGTSPIEGSVYIYERAGDSWQFSQKLFVEGASSIAIENNVIVVGAADRYINGRRGAISIFEYLSGFWVNTATFTSGGINMPENLGRKVGVTRGYVLTSAGASSVYAFKNGPQGWGLTQVLRPGPSAGEQFGQYRVLAAKNGRVFFDAYSTQSSTTTLVVGFELVRDTFVEVFRTNEAPWSNDKYLDYCGNTLFAGGLHQRSVITFERSDSGLWTRSSDVQVVSAPGGFNVLSVSCNSTNLAVAYRPDFSPLQVGIFRPTNGGWLLETTLTANIRYAHFSGNLLLGLKQSNPSQNNTGGVLTYEFSPDSGWSLINDMSPGPSEPQEFGKTIAVAGGLLVVRAGDSFFIYKKVGEQWAFDEKLDFRAVSMQVSFGQIVLSNDQALSVFSDIDGRWVETQRIAAPEGVSIVRFEIDGNIAVFGARRGTIPVILIATRENGFWRLTEDVNLSGHYVAVKGDLLVSTTPAPSTVSFFKRKGNSWELRNVFNQSSVSEFGNNIAISNDETVAVKASGSVLVFQKNGSSWGEPSRLYPPWLGYSFGETLGFVGNRLLIGYVDRDWVRDEQSIAAFQFDGQSWVAASWIRTLGIPQYIVREAEGEQIVVGAPSAVGVNSLNAFSGTVAIAPLSVHVDGFE